MKKGGRAREGGDMDRNKPEEGRCKGRERERKETDKKHRQRECAMQNYRRMNERAR